MSASFDTKATALKEVSARYWTVTTAHETTLFYDLQTWTFRHAREIREGWIKVSLFVVGHAGLLIPHHENVATYVKPVRVRPLPDQRIVLLSAACGLGEFIYSAKPEASENPNGYIEVADIAADWEIIEAVPDDPALPFGRKILNDFAELTRMQPEATYLIESNYDGNALRWHIALRDLDFVNDLGRLIATGPSRQILRRLGSATLSFGIRDAYTGLADWLDNGRQNNLTVRQIGVDFDVYDLYPHELSFVADFEILSRVRQYVNPNKRLCVLATLRNEGPYVIEWIAYHASMGVEHFFIYTNENSDFSEELLGALAVQCKNVTLIVNDARRARPQMKAYGHALKCLPEILDYEWAVVIDADEFVVLDAARFSRLPDYLAWIEGRPADAVALNWFMFHSSGVIEADLDTPVLRRFPTRQKEINEHVKTVFRPRNYQHSQAHYPFGLRGRINHYLTSNGDIHAHKEEPAHSVNPVAEAAWINHYWTKSEEEFCAKWARNGGDLQSSLIRTLDQIEAMRLNVRNHDAVHAFVVDDRIFCHEARFESERNRLLNLPGIAYLHAKTVAKQREEISNLKNRLAALKPIT